MQQVAYKAWTSVYQERTSAFALTDGCLGSLSQVMVTRGSYASTLNTNNDVYSTRHDTTRHDTTRLDSARRYLETAQ